MLPWQATQSKAKQHSIITDASTTYTNPILSACNNAFFASPRYQLHLMTRQHTPVTGGPSLHLLYFLSYLSWVRQSQPNSLESLRSLFPSLPLFFFASVMRSGVCRNGIRSNVVMSLSLSLWLEGDETIGKTKRAVGRNSSSKEEDGEEEAEEC